MPNLGDYERDVPFNWGAAQNLVEELLATRAELYRQLPDREQVSVRARQFWQGTDALEFDNLVQIAHNVVLGRHCVIVAQVGISGSTTLEDFVVLGGQVGVVGHLRIGAGADGAAADGANDGTDPSAAPAARTA